MRGASWLASTNQSWKLEASALSRWIGVGVTALGARLSVSRFAALGTVLAVVGVLIGFLGPVVLRLMIVCPTCRFRPYFHAPLVRGVELRQAEGCPRCGGNESADLVPLKTRMDNRHDCDRSNCDLALARSPPRRRSSSRGCRAVVHCVFRAMLTTDSG